MAERISSPNEKNIYKAAILLAVFQMGLRTEAQEEQRCLWPTYLNVPCPDGSCVTQRIFCNGKNCNDASYNFYCYQSNECIYRYFKCNGVNDCPNSEDESYDTCIAPYITTSSTSSFPSTTTPVVNTPYGHYTPYRRDPNAIIYIVVGSLLFVVIFVVVTIVCVCCKRGRQTRNTNTTNMPETVQLQGAAPNTAQYPPPTMPTAPGYDPNAYASPNYDQYMSNESNTNPYQQRRHDQPSPYIPTSGASDERGRTRTVQPLAPPVVSPNYDTGQQEHRNEPESDDLPTYDTVMASPNEYGIQKQMSQTSVYI